MLVKQFEDDTTALVLATAHGALQLASELTACRAEPFQDSDNLERDWMEPIVDGINIEDGHNLPRLAACLGRQLRVNALELEAQLATKRNAIFFPMEAGPGKYGPARLMCLNEQGDVVCLVGTLVGDPNHPVVIDPESPLVLKALAGHFECSLTDRVRVYSQLVCLYCDAIRFGGFRDCPLGDAVRLLRFAVGALRKEQPEESGESTQGADSPFHAGQHTRRKGEH